MFSHSMFVFFLRHTPSEVQDFFLLLLQIKAKKTYKDIKSKKIDRLLNKIDRLIIFLQKIQKRFAGFNTSNYL